MAIYHIINEKYNINFDLKFDTFYNFIDSLKESKKYYSDYCNLKNINIIKFDNEYIDNINILKSKLLKYYILITNDDVDKKFVVINDIIKELYFVVTNILNSIDVNKYKDQGYRQFIYNQIINENFNINYLTRSKLYNLIKIYAHDNCQPYWTERIRIKDWLKDIIPGGSNSLSETNFIKELNKYLDLLEYESIYERELGKILKNLPNICISHISSKKLLNNVSNKPNLIDFNEDLDDKYIAVD